MSPLSRRATGDTFSSFKHRNFRLFFTGQGISQIGNWLTLLAQSLLVYAITGSGVALGVLVGCQFLPVLLLGAWAGLVADRSDKRRLLILVQTLAMVQSFVLAALALADHPPVMAIYAVAVAGGVATAFDNPARRAFVVEMVPESDVQNAVSLNTAMMTGARVFGPALAGLLVTTVGYSWCFAIDGISYIAVIYGLIIMRSDELRRPEVPPRSKGQVRAGIRYTRSVPELWLTLIMMSIIGTLSFNFNVVLQLFVKRTFSGSDASFTLLLSVISVGSLISALVAARRRTSSVHQVAVAAAIFGVALLAMAAAPTLWSSYVIGLLIGFTSIMFITVATAVIQLRTSPDMRGRVLALQSILFLGSTPIGGPLLGAVCEYLGPRAGLVVGGLAAIGACVWGIAMARRHDGAIAMLDAVETPPIRTA